MKRWQRDLDYMRLVGPDEPRFDSAAARLDAHIEFLEAIIRETARSCDTVAEELRGALRDAPPADA